ncbi:serine hydrolase [Methylorubrum extorquens]|uniref:serine hydrolase n=1 Tax=Methylorubrum extorquens TaxID=408 RepID=UPI00209C737F|nr:serine hydrolase [Methylorubrum extorquens]MCP1538487.1 CubicO group peptidase (beta-lactamase class C family) [Methylorubrum extorquens]
MQRLRSHPRIAPVCVALGVISGCSGSAFGQAVTRAQVEARLPALEALAQQAIDAGDVPGLAIAIVYGDETLFLKGFGRRAIGKPDLVGPETVFQIASLSKPVTSTVVAALVGEGVVGWDARVADLDPGFRLHEPYPASQVTVRDFLNHRSGLPGSTGDDLEGIGYGRDDILRRLRLVPPSSSFRAGYAYSNFGFTEGAVAAARPTGKPWDVVAQEKLFGPLGMTSTSTRHDDFLTRADRAALHVRRDGVWRAGTERDPDAQAPAGGVSSNVRDLARWVRLEIGNGLFEGTQRVAGAALAQTHVPLTARGTNPVTGGASFYGLGWNIEYGRHGLVWGHAGAFSVGAQTLVSIHPDAKLGIVLLTNAFPSGVPEGLADSFADLVFDGRIRKNWLKDWGEAYTSLFGPGAAANRAVYGQPPANASASLPLAAYTGRYANAYIGNAEVAEIDGRLTLTVGPGGARTYLLRHFDRDLFLCFPDAEAPDNPSAIRFAVGSGGKADAVTLDALNANGLGTLDRASE